MKKRVFILSTMNIIDSVIRFIDCLNMLHIQEKSGKQSINLHFKVTKKPLKVFIINYKTIM